MIHQLRNPIQTSIHTVHWVATDQFALSPLHGVDDSSRFPFHTTEITPKVEIQLQKLAGLPDTELLCLHPYSSSQLHHHCCKLVVKLSTLGCCFLRYRFCFVTASICQSKSLMDPTLFQLGGPLRFCDDFAFTQSKYPVSSQRPERPKQRTSDLSPWYNAHIAGGPPLYAHMSQPLQLRMVQEPLKCRSGKAKVEAQEAFSEPSCHHH